MNNFLLKTKRGFTLIEILIVITIIGIISSIVLFSLSGFRNEQALKNTTVDIISVLNKARQNTLSSLNSNNYSVHFDTDKIVLFTGTTYLSSDPTNEIINFNPAVTIPVPGGINIGGGSNISFERLTGETLGGTITVSLVSNPSNQKTITINKTGNISSN